MNAIDVTGSCTYIVFNNKKILLECGLHQSSTNSYLDSYKINSEKFRFDPKEIDYVFICHSHVDHTGLLPRLYKEGCKAKIILNHETALITEALLRNCAFILNDEARILSKRYKREYVPIYTEDDVERVIDFFYEYNNYNLIYTLDNTISFQWVKNSHCPGAAQLVLTLKSEMKTRKILYTSDIGSLNTKNHYVQNTEIYGGFVDMVIMESTYGDNKRNLKKTREFDVEHLRVAINTVIERKGTIIMPAFSFARTQELLTTLYDIFHNDKNFTTEIIIDSKLSCEISDLYYQIMDGDDLKLWNRVSSWENVKFVTDKDESLAHVKDKTPKIVISSSGFCTSGRVISYLQEYLKDFNSMIIFSGFVGDNPSYLSYRIKNYDNHKTLTINKIPIPNRADCITMSTFSSHANHDDLLTYGSNLNTNCLVLVHGSTESKETLVRELKDKIYENNKTYNVRASDRDMSIFI